MRTAPDKRRAIAHLGWLVVLLCVGCTSKADLERVSQERDHLAGDLAQAQADLAALRDTNEAAKRIEQLRSEINEGKKRIASLESDVSSAKSAMEKASGLAQENAELKTEIKKYKDMFAMQMQVRGIEYPGVGQAHGVKANIDRGEVIVLDDGSIWRVSPLSRLDASLWMRFDEVTVIENAGGLYPYRLINTSQKESAEASCVALR